jgi:regulator of sigma E protease
MQALSLIFYSIVTLGALIFIHELGHFLAAKAMGMRVDRFSIGFPPRAFGKVIGETDYCISWVPVGGYVKIAGMIDESMDNEFLEHEPRPYEFRAKSLGARVLVISAGVCMNILLAFCIFWAVQYSQGRQIDMTTQVGYVVDTSAAAHAGLQVGDKILAVNGEPMSNWEEIPTTIYLKNIGNDITLDIDRGGEKKQIFIPRKSIPDASPQLLGIYEGPTVPEIRSLEAGKPAEKFGLQQGDEILTLDGVPVALNDQVINILHSHADKPLKITYKRGENILSGIITPNSDGHIGAMLGTLYTGPSQHIHYSLFQAIPPAVGEVIQAPVLFFASIRQLIIGRIAFKDSFGGPIKIAEYASESAQYGLLSYLYFLAQLSMTLATINILPVPALDGGHLAVMLIEAGIHREIPNKAKMIIQQTGFVLLLVLMAFVIYNDIVHF